MNIKADDRSNIIWTGNVDRFNGDTYPGKGNDIIYAGSGTDKIFYEKDGGDDTIYNFKTGDRIAFLDTPQFENVSLDGNNVILNLTNGNMITLIDATNEKIGIFTKGHLMESTLGNVSISKDTIKLASNYDDYDGMFNLSYYKNSPTNIDASAVEKGLTVIGDARSNIIWASNSGVRVYGNPFNGSSDANEVYAGEGNDIIYAGNGTDYIACGGGDDTIYNYKTGDYLVFGSSSTEYKNVSLKGNDIIVNLTNGNTITLKDAKDEELSIVNKKNGVYCEYVQPRTVGKVKLSGSTVKLNADHNGYAYLSDYAARQIIHDATIYNAELRNIDASEIQEWSFLHGNDKGNIIRAGNFGSSIHGGKGNDVIYVGNGKDVFYYEKGDGNDTIHNIGDSDEINLTDCSVKNDLISGNDVILNIDSGGKITLKDAVGKSLNISGLGTKTYSNSSDGLVVIPNPAADLVLGTESFDAGNSSLVSDESLDDSVIGVNTTNNSFITSSSIPTTSQLNFSVNKNNSVL